LGQRLPDRAGSRGLQACTAQELDHGPLRHDARVMARGRRHRAVSRRTQQGGSCRVDGAFVHTPCTQHVQQCHSQQGPRRRGHGLQGPTGAHTHAHMHMRTAAARTKQQRLRSEQHGYAQGAKVKTDKNNIAPAPVD
jgi:hypothetical protein